MRFISRLSPRTFGLQIRTFHSTNICYEQKTKEGTVWLAPQIHKGVPLEDYSEATLIRNDPGEWGRVHSLESFSTVDGEGIRYMVFIQGCNFRCIYCSNPDSWNIYGGKVMSVSGIVENIKKCLPYLTASGGGITASGGEPLTQPEFVSSLFRRTKELKLTTALDTTGSSSQEAWNEVLPHTDFVFLSVKGTTEGKYKQMSHSKNGYQKMLQFAKEVGKQNIPLILRYPLVPSFTDSKEEILQLIQLAKNQPSLRYIEILPYHTLGVYKWHELKLKYPLEGVVTPSQKQVQDVVNLIKENNVNVVV